MSMVILLVYKNITYEQCWSLWFCSSLFMLKAESGNGWAPGKITWFKCWEICGEIKQILTYCWFCDCCQVYGWIGWKICQKYENAAHAHANHTNTVDGIVDASLDTSEDHDAARCVILSIQRIFMSIFGHILIKTCGVRHVDVCIFSNIKSNGLLDRPQTAQAFVTIFALHAQQFHLLIRGAFISCATRGSLFAGVIAMGTLISVNILIQYIQSTPNH